MKPTTERLLQATAIVMLLWFGWSLAKETIIAQIEANNRAAAAEQRLRTLMAEKR